MSLRLQKMMINRKKKHLKNSKTREKPPFFTDIDSLTLEKIRNPTHTATGMYTLSIDYKM